MKREWCETELVRTEDGGYRVGTLDEVIYFTEEGILYRLPARVVKMTPVSPADPSLFEEGHYYDEETDAHVTLEKTENGCALCMLRYGKSELYRNAAGENIFSFGPDLTMYVKPENGSLILDGGRIKNIVLKKVDKISPTLFIKKIHPNRVPTATTVLMTTNWPASSPSPPMFCAIA